MQLDSNDVQIRMSWDRIRLPDSGFPRADRCHNCAQPKVTHAKEACLFGTTKYLSITKEVWLREFQNWASGQSALEFILTTLAYAASGGEP